MKQTLEEAASKELFSSYACTSRSLSFEGLVYDRNAMLNMFRKGAEWHATDSYRKMICCICGDTAYIFNSIKEASTKMHIPTTSIFNSLKRCSPMVSRGLTFYYVNKENIPSFDEILEANRDVLERIKEKGD